MTLNNTATSLSSGNDEIIQSIIQDKEIRRDFLCMALFEELAHNPNPNIANLFVFMKGFESLNRADGKDWNRFIRDTKFDKERFSEFFYVSL